MYGMYPPPWGMMPPPQNVPTEDQFNRAMRIVQKLQQRDEREKERKKINDRRMKEEDHKRAIAARNRVWLGIELYIFGIISQPFVYYGYTHLLKSVTP